MEVMGFQLSCFKSQKMMLLKPALNVSANLESSAMASGLEQVNFHSRPKEGQYQRMFKLPYNCGHFTCLQGNAPNPSRYALVVCELKTYRYTSWI